MVVLTQADAGRSVKDSLLSAWDRTKEFVTGHPKQEDIKEDWQRTKEDVKA